MNETDINIAINALIALDDDADHLSMITRELLIDDDAYTIDASDDLTDNERQIAHTIRILLQLHDDDALARLRLDYSLCPMHACDYAICFDDNDPECAQLRIDHPEHDT